MEASILSTLVRSQFKVISHIYAKERNVKYRMNKVKVHSIHMASLNVVHLHRLRKEVQFQSIYFLSKLQKKIILKKYYQSSTSCSGLMCGLIPSRFPTKILIHFAPLSLS
jgi:hypothetical protein